MEVLQDKEKFLFPHGKKVCCKIFIIYLVLALCESAYCAGDVVESFGVASLIKKFYSGVQTYQANFQETKGSRVRMGIVKLKKPDKLLIQYWDAEKKVQFSILSVGSKMYIEIPHFRVIVEQDMSFSGTENALLQGIGLVGTANIFKEYDFNFDTENKGIGTGYQILLTPKNNKILGLYPMQMQVGFDGSIEQTVLESSEGAPVSYRFFDIQKDLIYGEKEFEVQNADQFEILRNILVDLSSF